MPGRLRAPRAPHDGASRSLPDVNGQICGCPRDALCVACVTQRGAWLTGTAALRGERWGRAVYARATPAQRAQPWPPFGGAAVERAIAYPTPRYGPANQ